MISIGVTGHRQLDGVQQLSSAVDEVLRKIMKAYPGEILTIISPLAEGADRLVVQRASEYPDTTLVVPLPLPIDDYMTDFRTQESRTEFKALLASAAEIIELPPKSSREESYLAVGRYILDQCQILIAVWDGLSASGQGGTGQIVSKARRRRLPIAWIHTRNLKNDDNSQLNGAEQRAFITYEHFTDDPLNRMFD